ncbi:MAG: VanZ family protein [Oscillospiraceae bacterium]|nr:VanZ family protein [Oscillospiraceae bacterium]
MSNFFNRVLLFIYGKTGVFDEVIFSLPIVIAFGFVYWYERRVSHKKTFGDNFREVRKKARLNETIRLLLFCWLAEVICVTLFPTEFWFAYWRNLCADHIRIFNFSFWFDRFRFYTPNLIPYVLYQAIKGQLNWDSLLRYEIPHFAVNIALFVPLGVALPFVFKEATLPKAALAGFILSFQIEFLQFFIARDSDIDDVICNTLGAVLGYLLYLLMKKLFPKFTEKCKIQSSEFNGSL